MDNLRYLTLTIAFFMHTSATAGEPADQSPAYLKLLVATAAEIEKQFNELPLNKSKLSEKLASSFALIEKSAALSNEAYGKKVSEEKKSILFKQSDDLKKQAEEKYGEALKSAAWPILALLMNKEKPKKGKKIDFSEKALLNFFGKLSFSNASLDNSDFSLKLACIKPSIANDTNCLESVMKVCRSQFGSDEGKLASFYLDEDVKMAKEIFESSDEALTFFESNRTDKTAAAIEIARMFERAMVGACGTIATNGYSFRQNRISFKGGRPDWLSNLQFASVDTKESFNSNCLPMTDQRLQNIIRESNNENVSEYLRKDLKGSLGALGKKCRPFIQSYCENYESLKDGTVAYHYVTKACATRSVTKNDVSSDIDEWKRLPEITEASRLRHAEIIDDIEFCEGALKNGFYWSFRPPSSKSCKAVK